MAGSPPAGASEGGKTCTVTVKFCPSYIAQSEYDATSLKVVAYDSSDVMHMITSSETTIKKNNRGSVFCHSRDSCTIQVSARLSATLNDTAISISDYTDYQCNSNVYIDIYAFKDKDMPSKLVHFYFQHDGCAVGDIHQTTRAD